MNPAYVKAVLGGEQIKYGLTHFLCIPVCYPRSRSRLQNSFRNLARDPCAVNAPLEAYFSLESMHIQLGVLQLPTARHIDVAVKVAKEYIANFASDSESVADQHLEPIAPLTVHLVGLDCRPRINAGTTNHNQVNALGATAQDKTGRLVPFCRGLIEEYGTAGLTEPSIQERALREPNRDALSNRVKIIDTKGLRGKTLRTGSTFERTLLYAKLGRKRTLRFDAQDMYEKYKNHTWIDQLELERLSICEVRMGDLLQNGKVVGQGWHEVAAIPLPGFVTSYDGRLPSKEDITFRDLPPPRKRRIPLYLQDVDRERTRSKSTARHGASNLSEI